MNKPVHTTTTGQPENNGRDEIPTKDERIRPYSLDPPKAPGDLERHVRLTPLVLEAVLRECERRGLKLSDCKIVSETEVIIPSGT